MRIDHGAVLALVLAAGCIDQPDVDGAALAEAEQGIEIGTNDTSDPVRNAIVRVGDACTGTLIAPDVVLTSLWCGLHGIPYTTDAWSSIPPVTIYFGPDRDAPLATATADMASRHVTVIPDSDDGEPPEIPSSYELALLRLTAPVATSIAVARPVYVDRPATLSSTSTLHLIGYGGDRDRRRTTATGYQDWLTSGGPVGWFRFTPTHRGAGIGDDGNNIEYGDYGAPLLLGSATGHVLGALVDWTPGGVVSFAPGSVMEQSVRDWIQAKAPQRPDLDVISISVAGCTGTGGHPMVKVTLQNRGVRTASGWVDVFHGLASPPSIGTLSTIFRTSGNLAPDQTISMSFEIPAPPGPRWIDVLLDTTRSVDELDEGNNASAAFLELPDCSFG